MVITEHLSVCKGRREDLYTPVHSIYLINEEKVDYSLLYELLWLCACEYMKMVRRHRKCVTVTTLCVKRTDVIYPLLCTNVAPVLRCKCIPDTFQLATEKKNILTQ